MDFKLIFLIISVVLVSTQPIVFGDTEKLRNEQKNLEIGQLISSDKIIFEITKDEKIHVKHVIKFGEWAETHKHIELIDGKRTNLKVADEDGDLYGYGVNGNSFEESQYVILKQKLAAYDLIVEYDLEDYMILEDNLWSKKINYPFDIQMNFENGIEIIFANDRPVELSKVKGINCIGCNMMLDFFNDKQIFTEEILHEERSNNLELVSNKEIKNFNAKTGMNIIEFEVEGNDQFVVADIPLEIILNPFDVYLTDVNDNTLDQLEKIRKTEFSQNDHSVKVGFKAKNGGVISIVGASIDEHESLLAKIENRDLDRDLINNQSSMKENEQKNEMNVVSSEEIFSDWENRSKNNNSENDYMLIYVIIGIIIAIGIIVAIVKLKKN